MWPNWVGLLLVITGGQCYVEMLNSDLSAKDGKISIYEYASGDGETWNINISGCEKVRVVSTQFQIEFYDHLYIDDKVYSGWRTVIDQIVEKGAFTIKFETRYSSSSFSAYDWSKNGFKLEWSCYEHGGSGPFFEVDMYRLIDFKTDMDATTLNGLIIENNALLQDDFVITWPSWRFPFDEMGFEPHSEISSIRWTCQRFFAKGSFWLYKYTKGQMLYARIEIQLKENSNRTFMEGLNIIFETDYLLRQAIGKKIETSLSGTGVELQHDPERYNTTPIGGKSQIGETSVKQKYTTEEGLLTTSGTCNNREKLVCSCNSDFKMTSLGECVKCPFGEGACIPDIPSPPVTDEDICSSCAETGYTTETSCQFHDPEGERFGMTYETVGGPRYNGVNSFEQLMNSNEKSYEACAAKCDDNRHCQAFSYYDRIGIDQWNCHLKFGLFQKDCRQHELFVFSRKCALSKQCSDKTARCEISRNPFQVQGPNDWNCSDDTVTKSCHAVCHAGYKLGITVVCNLDESNPEDDWSLSGSANSLAIDKPGCQTCQDPATKYPIPFGNWECSGDGYEKACSISCSHDKVINGTISCQRSTGSGVWWNREPLSYSVNKYYKRSVRQGQRKGGLTCEVQTCSHAEFGDVLADYLGDSDLALGASDFSIQTKGTDKYFAYLLCLDGKPSKTKCQCKVSKFKEKRKFKCRNLVQRKNARKCSKV